ASFSATTTRPSMPSASNASRNQSIRYSRLPAELITTVASFEVKQSSRSHSSTVRMSRISIGTRRRNRIHINSRDSIPPVVHFILEYRQTKWSRGFSHRSEYRLEISTELPVDIG